MRASPADSAKPADASRPSLSPDTPVADLQGVGPKRAAAMAERGILTLRDLIFHLPSRYQDWRGLTLLADLAPGATVTVAGELGKISERPMRGSPWRRLASGMLTEQGGAKVRMVWFNLPGYMRGRMPAGERVLAHGRVSETADGGLEIVQPELHSLSSGEPPPVRPVYRLPASIGQRLFATLAHKALGGVAEQIRGALPDQLRTGLSISGALRYLHEPPADADRAALERGESPGHLALAFDELFAFELALCLERERAAGRSGIALASADPVTSRWLGELPFALTGAQSRALAEIGADLVRPSQMNRMLLGDVGSGKTIVAFWAALRAVECGYQAAIMAPTELLAEQHHASFQSLCGRLGIAAGLLTARVTGAARASTLRTLESGAMPIVFGTHAIIQERVKIRRLGLGVIDEQHRFGVFDRARLKALGAEANLLMMTATPIPRSLALSLFANLEVSFLDELPPGRTPIATEIFAETDLDRLEGIVREELRAGNRAYYVLPRIETAEDADDDEVRSVTAMAERLRRGALGEFRIAIMHGRMRASDKEAAMREFRDGAIQALVSTTVVEVGIDVPEASVIVIVAAERYGLAQLHQLRGRVGRGRAASRCFLVASREADDAALERLKVMMACSSGAEVAREDLRIRGPGDLLGARQTGALPLKFIHLVRDPRTIENARAMAEQWLRGDPGLKSPASQGARRAIRRMLAHGFSLGDVG
ncbi:MAG TPA: ATP-dependent DNA helicase RecG [Candidatus Binataceae bacterium]|nr:ATP-dependent DNA helicase RecG [Candidatus Binataceae bacterium]